jgi:hypothetical protein
MVRTLPVQWSFREEAIVFDAIKKYPFHTHIDIAKELMENPILRHRTHGAIQQRIGYIKRLKGIKY